jgi:Tol biopolymer transport system component
MFGSRLRRIVLLAAAISAVGMLGGTGMAAVEQGRIVFEGFDDVTGKSDLYTMRGDGTDVRRLTTDGASKGHPEWSPDGTKISFESTGYESGSCCSRNIYVMNADGSGRESLTETPDVAVGENFDATWAPDGSWLAFVSTRGEGGGSGDRELYRMNADGSAETQLTATDARTSDQAPAVSPDGSKIAFASDRANSGSDELLDVYTMNADGSDVTRLTFDGAYRYPLSSRSKAPAWSPDGTRIAFESTRNGNPEIWVMNADGSDPVNVSDAAGVDTEPAWSPDGSQITFTSNRAGEYDLWAVDAPAASEATASFAATFAPASAVAAGTPVNLTPGAGTDARSPDWGQPAETPATGCTILGTPNADVLVGTAGRDVICGLGGDDRIRGAGGNDVLKGGRGLDYLLGGGGDDLVIGGVDADQLLGGTGADALRSKDGVSGNDSLDGGRGTDRSISDPTERATIAIP